MLLNEIWFVIFFGGRRMLLNVVWLMMWAGFVVAAELLLLRVFKRYRLFDILAGNDKARFFARLTLIAIAFLVAFWLQIFVMGLLGYRLGDTLDQTAAFISAFYH